MNEPKTPKVTVIIPVFNTEKYLHECLESVINQTLKEIEIVCIDDGSTDNSLEILREYAAKDSRIKVYTQPNINAGAARNHGLCYAKGKYLSFLDSDDYFEPEMLADCFQLMEAEDADIVCFSAKLLDMRSGNASEMPQSLVVQNLPDKKTFSPEEISATIFNTFQNWPWNKLFRREFIEKNHISFQEIARTNDMLFTCSALALARRIAVINHAYAVYRVGTGTSLQQTNDKHPLSFWDAYTETKRFLVSCGKYEQYEQSFFFFFLSGALYNYHSIKDPNANVAAFCCIKYRGEDDFRFLSHDQSFYYNIREYNEYKHILERTIWYCDGMISTNTRRLFNKTIDSLKDYGLLYTLKRAISHLKRAE